MAISHSEVTISPGARRAAEALLPHPVTTPLAFAEGIAAARQKAAEIIERETRAGELAEALETLAACLMGELKFRRDAITDEWLAREFPTLLRSRQLLKEVRS